MNENDMNQDTRMQTPMSVMMDMAKSEIGNLVIRCMQKNNIPPEIMVYVLKDILIDITQAKIERLSEKYVDLQISISGQGE